jgi:hypothetical protein
MSRGASLTDFHAQYDAQGNKIPGTGVLYEDYRRYSFFADRAAYIVNRWAANVGKILIVGCGYGYLVDELFRIHGRDAWGVELTDYARNKASEVLPFASASRVVLADMANRNAMNSVRSAAGLTGQQNWGLVVTEDVLPVCTSEAEAQVGLTEVRRSANNLLHIITCTKPEQPDDMDSRFPGLLWRSRAQWRVIINRPAEVCLDTEGPGAGTEF